MDCIEFNKMIGPYLKDELTDAELNEFLHHLDACPQCSEELEINYIVGEGMERLDKECKDYNLAEAYRSSREESHRYVNTRKKQIRLAYIADTVLFWTLAMTIFVFLRVMLKGN